MTWMQKQLTEHRFASFEFLDLARKRARQPIVRRYREPTTITSRYVQLIRQLDQPSSLDSRRHCCILSQNLMHGGFAQMHRERVAEDLDRTFG